MQKRTFLKTLSTALLSPLFISNTLEVSINNNWKRLTDDESEFWEIIRSHYKIKSEYINLESGFYNIIPHHILEKHEEHIKRVNIEGSYYMRNNLIKEKKEITRQLAEFVGCDSNHLIITRNTTESLDLIIGGYPWNYGDEAIYADQDYGAMKVMFEQISKRYGVNNKIISIPNHPESDEEIVSLYESKITSKTKLIMVCHMINITGQILPISKICDMAHRHGVEVMVDGAHCVGHFDFKIDDFNCDYYGSSLHKWLATPLGAGLLYVNPKHTSKIWPLLADHNKNLNDINRLNHIGTHPVHINLAIEDSLEYINWIGIKRKEERLRYIQRYWTEKLRGKPNVLINTPEDPKKSCAIANVGLTNMSPGELADRLFQEHQVFTVAIDYANVKGCRISPNIFTTTKELDHFVNAIISLSKA
tara:strand:- start:12467 stop:13723 length:1257 start_codon:yes stop_codon:yes gene_type:complete